MLVQQHWNPPPPSPVVSFDWARRMYSPGAANFAVVAALPSASGVGLAFSNVTAPGPRNLLQDKVPPVPRPPRGGLSSLTHTASDRGSATFVVNVFAMP